MSILHGHTPSNGALYHGRQGRGRELGGGPGGYILRLVMGGAAQT